MSELNKTGLARQFLSIAEFSNMIGSDELYARLVQCSTEMLALEDEARDLRLQIMRYKWPVSFRILTERTKQIIIDNKIVFGGRCRFNWSTREIADRRKWDFIALHMNKCGFTQEERSLMMYFEARRAEMQAKSDLIYCMATYYNERYLWCKSEVEKMALPAWMKIHNTLDGFKKIHEVDNLVNVCAHSAQT